MGPGESSSTHLLSPPVFTASTDKLRWRKDVRGWMSTVRACADGGDGRAKGMNAALGMILYRSLPPSRQQLLEKAIEIGDIILDPSMPGYSNDTDKMINSIIDIVAKDSAPDAIKRLAKLSKDAATCVRKPNEPVSTFVEQFLLLSQGYLNLVSAGRASAVSQSLAMNLLSNANLSPQTFSSVMASLVTTTKNKENSSDDRILVNLGRTEKAINILETIIHPPSGPTVLNTEDSTTLTNFLNTIRSSVKHHKLHTSDSGLCAYISMSDAVAALDEVSIEQEEIEPINRTNGLTHTNNFLAHTKLARRFQRRDNFNRRGRDIRHGINAHISNGKRKTPDWRYNRQRFHQNDNVQQASINTPDRPPKQNRPNVFQ